MLLSKSHFDFIIDKMQKQLASWTGKLLNRLGKVMLANSMLSSLPYVRAAKII